MGMNIITLEIDGKGTCQIEGMRYPAIGFGTYRLKDEICFKAVSQAAELGYRIIDTATYYGNFIPIGKALKRLNRKNFYVISKVWPDAQTPERIKEDITTTLNQLQMTDIDAYFIHWPNSTIPIEETLHTMEDLRLKGFIRHIGLSNVTVNHLKRALELKIPILWVQVEMNPLFYDSELLAFCQDKSIGVQAWAPLSRGRISEDAMLNRIGQKYGKTASQIALKWIVQHRCIPLPASKNRSHMSQNLAIENLMLSREEMEEIDKRAKIGQRKRITPEAGMGFIDEFDFSYEQCWPKRQSH
jgi:diketogulonate reductase-like aldo/keto reductase